MEPITPRGPARIPTPYDRPETLRETVERRTAERYTPPPVNETKPAARSLTVSAGAVTVAVSLAVLAGRLAGVELAEAEATALVTAAITLASGVAAIVGRVRARARIGSAGH